MTYFSFKMSGSVVVIVPMVPDDGSGMINDVLSPEVCWSGWCWPHQGEVSPAKSSSQVSYLDHTICSYKIVLKLVLTSRAKLSVPFKTNSCIANKVSKATYYPNLHVR